MEPSEPFPKSVKHRIMPWLSTIFGLTLFCIAVWFLHRQLQKYRLSDILEQLQAISLWHVWIALLLIAVDHVVLTGFDFLGVHYVKQPIPYRRIALASFVSYVLSHNIGFSTVSGAPFRFRIYSRSGLSAFQITTIVAWCGLSFWIGFFSLGGALFLAIPYELAAVFSMNVMALRILGGLFLLIIALYLLWSWEQLKSIKLYKWLLWPPKIELAMAQILLSCINWVLTATALYFLFPVTAHLPYFIFLGVFLIAQASGFTSQIPGGLGVFETIFITFLAPQVPADAVLGTLIAFRGLYYILPLVIGVMMMGASELMRKRHLRHP